MQPVSHAVSACEDGDNGTGFIRRRGDRMCAAASAGIRAVCCQCCCGGTSSDDSEGEPSLRLQMAKSFLHSGHPRDHGSGLQPHTRTVPESLWARGPGTAQPAFCSGSPGWRQGVSQACILPDRWQNHFLAAIGSMAPCIFQANPVRFPSTGPGHQ